MQDAPDPDAGVPAAPTVGPPGAVDAATSLAAPADAPGPLEGAAAPSAAATPSDEHSADAELANGSATVARAGGELAADAAPTAAAPSQDTRSEPAALASASESAETGGPASPEEGLAQDTPDSVLDVAASGLVEPVPFKSPIASSALLSSDPPSLASTAILASLNPPTPSVSPAPTKKFASSLSVNKKFLEKAGDKSKPEVKATIARLATPPVVAPVSTSHPRLNTGKISSAPSLLLSATQVASGPSGWVMNSPAPEGQIPPPPTGFVGAGRGATYERGRGLGTGMASRGRGAGGWGSRAESMGIGSEFPTAAEAANEKVLRAAAVAEQVQSRERAVQARAAAAAAANAHLLEGLDAFRGVHLDPNASHWDEMGDDEDDFLNETVEFGDGTQYKIDADAHPPQSATQDYLREPDPSNFATREAPLAPGESHSEQHSREERFKDDYDRTWSKRASGDAKNLFNDRLGKLEPYASSRSTPGAILGRGLPPVDTSHRHDDSRSALSPRADAPPHLDRGPPLTSDRRRRESNSSQRSDQGRIEPPRAWGQNQARADHGFGSGAAARRPSIEQAGQGRQLPPHLSGIVSPRLSSRDLPRTVSHASPPMQHAQLPSISAVIAPVVAATPVPASATPGADVAPTLPVVAPVVIDLEELHVREMHAAAERAKIRRQEEEEGRMAQVERAKKKAAEIEERIRLAAEAAAPKVSAATTKVAARTSAGPPPNSWRKALPATTPAVAPTPVLVPAAKSEPVRILARNNGPAPALPVVRAPSAPVAPPHQNPSLILAQAINSTRPTPPHLLARPAPPPAAKVVDDREWRRDPVVEPRSREPPPHLGAAEPQAAPRAERVRTESVPPSRAAVVADPALLRAVPTSAKGVPLPVPLLRPIPITPKPVFKPRELSQLDDLMSRIKGVMNTPKPTVADAPETVLISQSASPVSHATVRLPGAIVAPVVVPGAFVLLPANLLPPPVSDVKLGKGRGRQTEPRKPVRAPVVEKRDIPMLFHTGMERSASPPPAWRAFIVRLASYPKAAPPSIRQVKAFSNPATPLRVNVQSPFRKLMREDPMHPRKFNRGRPVVAVATPKHTLARRTQDQEAAFVFATLSVRKLEPELTARRGKGRVPAAETERLDFELAQGTTVPSSADLFDVGPSHSPLARSRLPSTANTPPPLINGRGDSPRKFMVTGGLNGEEVVKLVLRNLAAPGAPAVPALPVPSSTAPIFESSSSTSPSATSTWSATAPMSHSLLDPMTPSVWSAPPVDAPVHARSISLGGVQIGNSLEGIADDDPSATIPQSLAELKSEDEGSVSGKVKDDARLRAAAPAFSTFSDSATGSGSPDRPPQSRYPFRQPQPQPHQYQLPSSSPYPQGYPSSYGQMPQYSPYATHQQLPSSYSPAMQAYSQGPFSLSPQQQQGSPFNPYRPNVVQNPGFGMSYGAIGAGTSFGAVGGGAHGNIGRNAYPTRSPVMAPYMTGGYMNGFGPPAGFQGRDPSFGSPQSEGPPRHVGNGYISSSSPVMMPQHLRHPSFHPLAQSQPFASNPSSFEASPQGMGVIGRGGPPAPLPAASGPVPSPQAIQRPE